MAIIFVSSTNQAFASTVTILNPSFENPTLSSPGTNLNPTITGWDVTVVSPNQYIGVWYPDYGVPRFTAPMPDGNQAAYNDGGSICQTTTQTYAPGCWFNKGTIIICSI